MKLETISNHDLNRFISYSSDVSFKTNSEELVVPPNKLINVVFSSCIFNVLKIQHAHVQNLTFDNCEIKHLIIESLSPCAIKIQNKCNVQVLSIAVQSLAKEINDSSSTLMLEDFTSTELCEIEGAFHEIKVIAGSYDNLVTKDLIVHNFRVTNSFILNHLLITGTINYVFITHYQHDINIAEAASSRVLAP